MTEELRRFIMVDNHAVLRIGDFVKILESLLVLELLFAADFFEAVVREGADE